MKNTSNSQPSVESIKSIGVGKAILIGHLVVNLPVLIIMLAGLGIGLFIIFLLRTMFPSFPNLYFLLGIFSIAISFISGWLWWSFAVPRWRKWALKNGAPEDELQRWAEMTGLVWPKGLIFEKTEFKIKE